MLSTEHPYPGPSIGMHVRDVCEAMIATANTDGNTYWLDFNGIKITARPGGSAEDMEQGWEAESQARAEAYRATPKYAAQQERRRAAKEREDAEWERPVPCFEHCESSQWEAWLASNGTERDYNGAIIRAAARIAHEVDKAVAVGVPLAEAIKEQDAHWSGLYGLTGFQHGGVVAVLRSSWVHGDVLYRMDCEFWGREYEPLEVSKPCS